jgi:hypothetical protein
MIPSTSPNSAPKSAQTRTWLQWRGALIALAVSIALHSALISTAGHQVRVGDASGELPHTITADLRRAPAPSEPPRVASAAQTVPVRPRSAVDPTPVMSAPVLPMPVEPAPVPDKALVAPAAEPAVVPAPEPAPATAAGTETASTALNFSHWPPNGTLSYQAVHSVYGYDNRKTYGVGDIRWRIEGERYRIEQDIALDLVLASVRVLAVTSEGKVGLAGLAPERYTEQVRSKAPLATNFNREGSEPNITFSASVDAYRMPPDVQDRASVIFQLAAIVRNSATPFKKGDTILIPVAGVRSLDPWNFHVGEMEWLETGLGRIQALRLVRIPHPETKDKKVELWFAPDYEWLPVHIVHTENNGDTTEMTARGWKATK